jgi:hypothetical protein
VRILRSACMCGLACLAVAIHAANPPAVPALIDPNDESLQWRTHRSHESTCIFTGTAVSEKRDDAFEVQFRQSRGQELKLFVIIPKLPRGGTVFMEAPTTRDRWKIFTENYKPALAGAQAESLRRNVATGIPLMFTFEFGQGKRVTFQTVAKGSITAAFEFTTCVNQLIQEGLEARKR